MEMVNSIFINNRLYIVVCDREWDKRTGTDAESIESDCQYNALFTLHIGICYSFYALITNDIKCYQGFITINIESGDAYLVAVIHTNVFPL